MVSEQVRKNLFYNAISLIAYVFIGIFYTPYLVKNLGLSAYGVLPIALVINQYVGVLTNSLTSALTRFYTISIQNGNNHDAAKYLNTSFAAIFAIIVLLILPLWFLLRNIENIFSIPYGLVEASKLLFLFTVLSFFLSMFSSIFNIILYAINRLDLLNIINIVRVCGKFILIIFLFSIIDADIKYVGLASLITEVFLLFFSMWAFYRFSHESITINWSHFNFIAFRSVAVMSVWTIVHQLGDMGVYRIDTLLVNIFWTSKESAVLGAFGELGNYIIMATTVFSSLFGPLILAAYTKGDHSEVVELALDRSLSVGVLVAVLIGLVCGFSTIILKAWMNEEIVFYKNWLYIKLALVPFYAAAGVFPFVSRARNKVRFPAIMTVVLGFFKFVLLYSIARFYGKSLDNVQIILVVGLFFGLAQGYFLNGLYFSKYYPGTRRDVLTNFLKILITLIISFGIGLTFSPIIAVLPRLWIFLWIAIISIFMSIAFFKIMLNKRQLSGMIELVYSRK